MLSQFKNKVMHVPSAMSGLALGIASLGLVWESVIDLNNSGPFLGASLAAILIIFITVKYLLHPKLLKADLAHPVAGSVIPTFAMTNFVISHSVGLINPFAGDVLWSLAFLLHLIFLTSFVYHRVKKFNFEEMNPSWFVPPVGIIIAEMTFSGNPSLAWLAYGALIVGMSMYSIMLPIMLYRFIVALKSNYTIKPILAILAAPASLTLVGYLHLVAEPSIPIVKMLFILALAKTLIVYFLFIKLINKPFSPSYAAFTFPMVVGSTALFNLKDWMKSTNVDVAYITLINQLAILELLIATMVVGYISIRYFYYFKLTNQRAN
ncbi:TDT family transporter [Alteromonas sp. C1M14]|uniref:TDT family transporter n=1 Tax=Alteromonas sp. C1M14 TaxID=2841567 RepID=UPI001C09654D|nr:TDT family transporter [Alteromonas sp. C1M14]MBU2978245.1 TDT family transporter [Alteromonas sp. C1M14]